ncbi:CDP-glycerol glycerophosphotransferase family protein [Agromyces sp. Leaf222]|uniref:CDP-glycerol glycerophosphotransferase family protein n=1 Tax=Agromyces sp. Leaf222 TaxID=1735688 RepID=UPI00138ED056|nr:CDP-glycerol glycerophosphotransferase family protein [Agromyces sp. Leaf222]
MPYTFTLVSAVYDVDRYLDEFFASLVAQTYGFDRIEVILVDDGSTDDSLARCRAFADAHANVRVIAQRNAGQGAARNAGLAVASGEWLTFVDPDDVLDERYFAAIDGLMAASTAEAPTMFGGHTIMWNEETGVRSDTHPTAFRFHDGDVVVDLDERPNFISGQAPLAFVRTAIVREQGISFDDRLRTRFEDGKFVSDYLLAAGRAVLGLAADARYYYRRRADGSSTLQLARSDVRTYESVAVYGYLPLIERAVERHGAVPMWLQTLIVYDLLWLMLVDERDSAASATVPASVLATFSSDVERVIAALDREAILGFDLMRFPLFLRFSLAQRIGADSGRLPVSVDGIDDARGLVRVRFAFTGERPRVAFSHDGAPIEPRYEGAIVRRIFGRTGVSEYLAWVASDRTVAITIDGEPAPVVAAPAQSTHDVLDADLIDGVRSELAKASPPLFRPRVGALRLLRSVAGHTLRGLRHRGLKWALADLAVAAELRLPGNRRKYLDAWAVMDREWDANDSGEELYRWIRANHPEVNAWFVLSADSPDWQRLSADGFSLVAYGSRQYRVLMLLASELVSSHADAPIVNPFRRRYGREPWRFTFLQHGVIKGDLSGWLNSKPIDTFVTSTPDEYAYLSGAGPYTFTEHEVRLTGLPRFDALSRKADARSGPPLDIVVAPTWRKSLSTGLAVRSQRHARTDGFMESEFARTWKAFITSPALRELAESRGLRIVFMPHPNLQQYLDEFDLPADIHIARYGDDDVQEIVAGAAVLVTDYSSIAFNLAYLERPAVYLQFDREQYWAEHTERPGYFDYETHGFGPVTDDAAQAIDALASVLDGEAPEYAERARRTFPVRDGRNSERVYNAIVSAGTRIPADELVVAAEPDRWEPPTR